MPAEDGPYKKAMSAQNALAILDHEAESGAFDLQVVAVLRSLVESGRFVPRASGAELEAKAAFDLWRDAWR